MQTNEIKIVVTGGAGFIGSHIVEELNRKGHTYITIIDDFKDARKLLNLKGLKFGEIINIDERKDFYDLDSVQTNLKLAEADIIFNQGANSSTTEKDGTNLLQRNVYSISRIISTYFTSEKVISHASSASVYGDGDKFSVDQKNENPINAYAMTKYLTDNDIRKVIKAYPLAMIQSWRYFNVYGEREDHKDGMRSMVSKFCNDRTPIVFKGSDKVSRDFVYVKDVAEVVVDAALRLYEMKNNNATLEEAQKLMGIFNLGTGKATNVQEIVNHVKERRAKCFKEVPFPSELKGKYQYFTEADMSKTPLPKDFEFKTVFDYIDKKFPKKVEKELVASQEN